MIQNEISYYEEFSKKFSQYLNTYLGEDYSVFYSCNKTLDSDMVEFRIVYYQKSVVSIGERLNLNRRILAVVAL